MTEITNASTVTLYFSLALENGDIVDSNFGKDSATFVMGDGSLLPSFEEKLLGLKPQDKKTLVIPAAEAFGEHNMQNVRHYKRSDFDKDMELTKGLIVFFADKGGAELPGVIQGADEKEVVVDFNHPLAGRDITFTVEIVDVH
ncbi:MAG: FKBP-type peptidyl-prolyl cis-trans isomerase [Cellvibrionales bacterium]|nr:FKBP-type peptidyl-prolyl cis-trans isomerase [Cellvibrionales bacterium]